MRLSQVIADIAQARVYGDKTIEILLLTCDSRRAAPGALYFCLRGLTVDGHTFAASAVENGAVALVVEEILPHIDVPQVLVGDAREAMALCAGAFYGHPSRSMTMIGVTGTKGKTSVTYYIRGVAERLGKKSGVIGTICSWIGAEMVPGNLTTPDPIELQSLLARMRDAGVEWLVMEVSAHALALHKLAGIVFDVGVYTNLSQDHLDFFGTMERYGAAKKTFFADAYVRRAVINRDDATGRAWLQDIPVPVTTYGFEEGADISASSITPMMHATRFLLQIGGRKFPVMGRIPGKFAVYNALAAAGACSVLGVAPEDIQAGLVTVEVPGRCEPLPTGRDFGVILDYAHSPDSLRSILETVRVFTTGRIICVFGCGGDRDKAKRLIMGRIAGELSDYCIATSDNPRTENPHDILAMIEPGLRESGVAYCVIENRREAILHALSMARSGDCIVLAGKGHETYQEIGGVKHPFDERLVVAQCLQALAQS